MLTRARPRAGALHYGNWANLTEWLCTFAVIGFAMTWIHDWRRRLNVTTNLSLTARRADRMFEYVACLRACVRSR